jgi:hypothetical protein
MLPVLASERNSRLYLRVMWRTRLRSQPRSGARMPRAHGSASPAAAGCFGPTALRARTRACCSITQDVAPSQKREKVKRPPPHLLPRCRLLRTGVFKGNITSSLPLYFTFQSLHGGKSLQLKLFRQFHHFVSILAAITSRQRWCIVLILSLTSESVILFQALKTASLSLLESRCTSGSISCKISFRRSQMPSIGDRSGENAGQKIGTRFHVFI